MNASRWMIGVLALRALAAQEVPLQRPEELEVTRIQSRELYDVLAPVTREAGRSTVQVRATRQTRSGPKSDWVATGTVVGDGGTVLTKWSELGLMTEEIFCVGGDGRTAVATVVGVYPEEDVAMLQLEGERFRPIEFSDGAPIELGRFLVASGPETMPYGFGVVAVEERALGDSQQPYLGIRADPTHEGAGVRIEEVVDDGGAKAAGLRDGDILRKVESREVNGLFELQNALQPYSPGDTIELSYERDGEPATLRIELVPRPKLGTFSADRLQIMRQMGTEISAVHDDFPVVIQTDMRLDRRQCGGPVVDLDGKVVGMTIARTDRTRSFILPASRLRMILGQEPMDPVLAREQQQRADAPQMASAPPPRAVAPLSSEQVQNFQRNLEEVQEFLDRLNREMSGIGE